MRRGRVAISRRSESGRFVQFLPVQLFECLESEVREEEADNDEAEVVHCCASTVVAAT